MDHPAIRLTLELDPGPRPVRGRVRGPAPAGAAVAFTGWLELLERLEALTRAGDGGDETGEQEVPRCG